MRGTFDGTPTLIDRTDIQKAILLSKQCFGDRWALTVSLMIVSMEHRKRDDATLTTEFQQVFAGKFPSLTASRDKRYMFRAIREWDVFVTGPEHIYSRTLKLAYFHSV